MTGEGIHANRLRSSLISRGLMPPNEVESLNDWDEAGYRINGEYHAKGCNCPGCDERRVIDQLDADSANTHP